MGDIEGKGERIRECNGEREVTEGVRNRGREEGRGRVREEKRRRENQEKVN